MPPSATAATGPQPSRRAVATPGAALAARSSSPAAAEERRVPTSSPAVYSRPRVNSSRITPISAPAAMNSSLVASGRIPPWPKASPASKYSGMGEMENRTETAPSRPRARMTAPSSISSVEACIGGVLSLGQDRGNRSGALGGADHHDHITGVEDEVRARAGEHVPVAHHGHDGGAGAGPGAGVPQRPAGVARAGRDRDLLADQALDLALQLGKPLDDAGRAEQLGQRVGLLRVQHHGVGGAVGVVAAVDDHVPAAGAM